MNRKILCYVIMLFVLPTLSMFSKTSKSVLVIPFKNDGPIEIGYFDQLIQKSLISFITLTQEFDAIDPASMNDFLRDNGLLAGDLRNQNSLLQIGEMLKANYIINGKYYKQENFLVINFEVIEISKKKIIYRSSKFGKSGVDAFDTINNMAKEMVQDFTGITFTTGKLKVVTDYPCKVFIDNKFYGDSPLSTNLYEGFHKIKLTYTGDNVSGTVLEKSISIKENEEERIDLAIFVNLEVSTEKQCDVYINKKFKGTTPYKEKLLINNEYNVKLTYFNENKKEVVAFQDFTTHEQKDIKLHFNVTANIKLVDNNNMYHGQVVGLGKITSFPLTYSNILPGKYRVKIFLYDEKTKFHFTLYDKKHYLFSDETRQIDFSGYEFNKKIGYCFIPSAAQWYHKQYAKASTILTFFTLSLLTAALSPAMSYLYYLNTYYPAANEAHKLNDPNKYSADDINEMLDRSNYFFYSMLTGGIISTVLWYLFSLIDGLVNTQYIYKLFNSKKNKISSGIIVKPVLQLYI